MYDALMTVYGNAPTDSLHLSSSQKGGEKYVSVDEQLWADICASPHLGEGPSLQTMSARIVCHARTRRLDLIKSDLAFLRSSTLQATIHDLTENAQLSIVRAYIESAALLRGFQLSAALLSRSTCPTYQAKVVNTLLKAGQHIRPPPSASPVSFSSSIQNEEHPPERVSSSGPSRAQLLKRFLRHFSHLHKRFPTLQPTLTTLSLFIRLLDKHQQWIETETLWNMLRIVGKHFGEEDERLIGVLEAFVKVFEGGGK